MKQTTIFIVLLMFAVVSLLGQGNNYSPCYNDNMRDGNKAFKEGRYNEAKTYYVKAKQCNGGNPAEAQQKINSCDEKINAQKNEAEEKRKAEEAAAEARRKAEKKAAEAKREAEEAEAKRKAEEVAEVKREAEKATRKKAIAEAKVRGYEDITVNGVTFRMIYVEGGTFKMGAQSYEYIGANYDPDAGVEERPPHRVSVDCFFIGQTEVTQALWMAVMGNNPSKWKGYNLPVESVSYNDCQEFISKLNNMTGRTFRLPSEEEWEFAARGGNGSNGYKYPGCKELENLGHYAWFKDNSDAKTHPVAMKKYNELELYDMGGNVLEWCCNLWTYYGDSSVSSDTVRSLRGGYWNNNADACRVTDRRYRYPESSRCSCTGFRLVQEP